MHGVGSLRRGACASACQCNYGYCEPHPGWGGSHTSIWSLGRDLIRLQCWDLFSTSTDLTRTPPMRVSVPVLTACTDWHRRMRQHNGYVATHPRREPGGQTLPLNATEGGRVMPGPTHGSQSALWYTQPTRATRTHLFTQDRNPDCGRTVVWGGTTTPVPGERGACRVPDGANGRPRRGYGHNGWTRGRVPDRAPAAVGLLSPGGPRTVRGSPGEPGDTSSGSRHLTSTSPCFGAWGELCRPRRRVLLDYRSF